MSQAALQDRLVAAPGGAPAFDRVYFNLHGSARDQGYFVLGIGTYPPAATTDAYLCYVAGGENAQRNLRLSTVLEPAAGGVIGPLHWQCIEPHELWRLQLGANPAGVEFDLRWHARSAVIEIPEYSTADQFGSSHYVHIFQSGTYEGFVSVDGKVSRVDGWHGQRDRSKGQRRIRDRLGLHLWVQAQFRDECIGFLYNEDRQGKIAHFEGASMRGDRTLRRLTSLTHDLRFNDDMELVGGAFQLAFADGERRELSVVSTGPGILMQGGGYNGWHGVARGRDHIESERWSFDGSRTPRNLEIGITDALCLFTCGSEKGTGISEYALSRSPSYRYRAGDGSGGQQGQGR